MRRTRRGEIDTPRTWSFVRPWILIALAAVAAAVILLRGGGHDDRMNARVVRDVDGDTIVASSGGRRFYVRLLGIDTPETHRPGRPVECGGPEASAHMRRLAPPGTRVRLETDPAQDRVDRYGRLLAYVWLPGGRLAEDEQLRAGWAESYVFAGRPVSRYARLLASERAARREGLGVWRECAGRFHSAL
jgi:micrococcal nuclease